MKRFPARRAALVAAALVVSSLAPGLAAPAGATYLATVSGTIRDSAGRGLEGTVTLFDSAGAPVSTDDNGEDGFRLFADGGPATLRFEAPDPALPASATLPGGWVFDAPIDVQGDTTLDLTVPDAAPADVVVTGVDGLPVTGATMRYSAGTDDPIDLGSGVTARAVASDAIADTAGHFAPQLFGRSTLTFTLDGGPSGGPVTVGPGEQVTVALAPASGPPGAPRNVTAASGDGKVKVSWDPPASDAGSPITGYTVTASHNRSNYTATFRSDATAGTIRGLVNGKDYTVTVVAKNANGTGSASTPVTVTLDVPDPPATTTGPGSGAGSGGDPVAGAGSGGDTSGTGQLGSPSARSGYWLLGSDGAVYAFGDAAPYGDISAILATVTGLSGLGSAPSSSTTGPGPGPNTGALQAVDLEPTPSGQGYWVLDTAGRVHPFGDAPHLGDVVLAGLAAGETPASLSATPTGAGYWVFTNRGRAIPFGDAGFLGDMSRTALNGPVLDSVATPSGHGYYMVASDGGIFAFGDARFAGSMGGRRLNAPVRSVVPDADGTGYWLVASDGGIFAFDAPFRGSMGGQRLNRPVRGMVRYGAGYVMVAEDGGVFAFSDKPFTGSLAAHPPASPITAVAAIT